MGSNSIEYLVFSQRIESIIADFISFSVIK